ncbi:DUF4156 domain-containing protein [Pseudorhodoferax soli]|uniref:Uncharacterized protein DUF4156 n=1 Tax=Pseudorhodoferax soli TaxID=545864 RepID=A0A368XE09_9BURK|nr:DUF4156 domain-containing protein [Pseudorhodoferax soli]RCW66192.1 uncharacterized protein DUF4156 [Pseudorhodoferax soli]
MNILKASYPIAAVALLALTACSAVPVTQGGAAVELISARPTGCKALGEVIGSQGNVFSGDFTSNENLMVGARNDLRNKAAAMGGNVVAMQNTLNATHPYSTGNVSTTIVGNVYACPAK